MFPRMITFLIAYGFIATIAFKFGTSYLSLPKDIFGSYEKRNAQSSCEHDPIPHVQPKAGTWLGWGADVYNNRWASDDSTISSASVSSLRPVCELQYSLGVSAAPLVENNMAYYPTHDGLLVALQFTSCVVTWQVNITDIIAKYKPVPANLEVVIRKMSRTTPVTDGDNLYVGTQANALLLAIHKHSGKLLDVLQISEHPAAILTQSPTFYKGIILIGVSSLEELLQLFDPDYPCCTFTGSMNAVIMTPDGLELLWTQKMAPTALGWSGSSIWGSQPAIDPIRRQVFIATGNTYRAPNSFSECQNQTANIDGLESNACLPSDVYQESILALDLESGRINWVKQVNPVDVWNVACPNPVGNATKDRAELCPDPGPDFDFAMAPTFVRGSKHTPYQLDMIVVGQKSGALYALNAMSGSVLWQTITSPGGLTGGLSWGIAVDDSTVYYTAINSLQVKYILPGGETSIQNSAFGAASLVDGHIIWQAAAPRGKMSRVPPTVVNDIVLTGVTGEYTDALGNMSQSGTLIALDKRSGALIREYPLGGWFGGGIAVVYNYVMFGTGYSSLYPSSGSFHVWNFDR